MRSGMSLRWTTALIIAVTVVGLSATTYGIGSWLADRRFSDLEQRYAERDVDRVVNAIQANVDQIATSNVDWSAWDETYDFVAGDKPDYVATNLTSGTLTNL